MGQEFGGQLADTPKDAARDSDYILHASVMITI